MNSLEDRLRSSERRARILGDVGMVLSSTLEYGEALQNIGPLLVPSFADWCTIDMLGDDGNVELVAVAHSDPSKVALGYELKRRFPVEHDAPYGVGKALRTGETEFIPYLTPELVAATTNDPDILAIVRELGFTSIIYVPLIARERTLGVLSLVTAESARRFTEADRELAELIAARTAIAIDNTRLFRQAEEARRDAEEANAAKDKFLAVLSHELRTPLTPVLGALGLLQEELSDRPHVRELVEMMARNVELEARLIDDLLDVTQIRRGTLRLNRTAIDLHEITRNVHEIWAGDAEAKGVALELDARARATTLDADPARLHQVIWNLVGNALKFTPSGGRVRIATYDEGDDVVIEVRDTGLGIDREIIELIFDPFEQGDRSRAQNYGGLGLGLSIVRSIVEMHGGTVTASSGGPGSGSAFTVRLPVAG